MPDPQQKQKIVITAAKNIAPILAEEVKALGFPVPEEHMYDVVTEGTLNDTMVLNLHLRTAHRVLLKIHEAPVSDPEVLYKVVHDVPWEDYLLSDGYFSVRSFVENDYIKDLRFANLKTKDAIVDRMQAVHGHRPDTGPSDEQAVIFLYWKADQCTLYVDTSGATIAKHNYRKIPFTAPMLESLAAAAILSSRWDPARVFVNPMCGSGTLAIEAALLAINKPPGLMRNNFGFMHIKGYDRKKWGELRKNAQEKINRTASEHSQKIIASDHDPEAIRAAKTNARNAGVEHLIRFETCDFNQTTIPQVTQEPGNRDEGKKFPAIFFNPEYGERLGEEEKLRERYKQIGDFLKNHCQGYMGYIFTGNLNLGKNIGLRTSRKIILYTAKMEARLLEYMLYAGKTNQSQTH